MASCRQGCGKQIRTLVGIDVHTGGDGGGSTSKEAMSVFIKIKTTHI